MENTTNSHAEYSCDRCRQRKIACSRETPQCQQCQSLDARCEYSRSGVLRRVRKRKTASTSASQLPNASKRTASSRTLTPTTQSSDRGHTSVDGKSHDAVTAQSNLTSDIDAAQDRLRGEGLLQQDSIDALSTLAQTSGATWQYPYLEFTEKKFFNFGAQAAEWVEILVDLLARAGVLFDSAPPNVLLNLRANRPESVRPRAWLIIFYGVVLSARSSTHPEDHVTKHQLQHNIWLALNDPRLLLEPTEINIRALTLLSTHVEEFTTPSLSWMLATTACRMLQALGVTHRRFDATIRTRRQILFWYLNLLDKGMALVFGRPPSFHRAMCREVEIPRLDQLVSFQPHATTNGIPSMFGVHFLHQIFQSSRVVADLWYCLYDDQPPDDAAIEEMRAKLEEWYHRALQTLNAAAMTEKPFLDAKGRTTIDLGLATFEFNHEYYLVLLYRASPSMRPQCINSSRRMLHMLEPLVSDSQEPFNGIIWQLVCCPFTPFLILFSDVLSSATHDIGHAKQDLKAMYHLPKFLEKMSLRNTLAARLHTTAATLLQHAESSVMTADTDHDNSHPLPLTSIPSQAASAKRNAITDRLPEWNFFAGPGGVADLSDAHAHSTDIDLNLSDFNFLGDVDWMGLTQFYQESDLPHPGFPSLSGS